jgi:hypothetical protein
MEADDENSIVRSQYSKSPEIRSEILSEKPLAIDFIHLDDVKSPFETEAEETILQAIEEAEKKKSLAGGVSPDRDNILNKVPAASLHLFGDDHDEEEPPNVFSLQSIDAGAAHAKSGSESSSRLKNMVRKVQLVRNAVTARPRVSSLESVDVSLVYSTHSRVPSNIPSATSHVSNYKEPIRPIEPSSKAPELFEIVDHMKTIENLTSRQNAARRTANNQYVELPTKGNVDDDLEKIPDVDPESLMINSSNDGRRAAHEYPRGGNKLDSNRASVVFRRCCLPCFSFKNLIGVQKKNIKRSFKAFFLLLVPIFCLAFILFYIAGNPGNFRGASYSWWCLFAIRLGITLTLARITEFILIDYIALETSLSVRFIGRLLTLMLIQAKGWPILCVYWGIWNFSILHGSDPFAKHWFYWCSGTFGIFDEEKNPSGGITWDRTYTVILATMIITGVVIMVKRLLVSLLLGKKKYGEFSPCHEMIMTLTVINSFSYSCKNCQSHLWP